MTLLQVIDMQSFTQACAQSRILVVMTLLQLPDIQHFTEAWTQRTLPENPGCCQKRNLASASTCIAACCRNI